MATNHATNLARVHNTFYVSVQPVGGKGMLAESLHNIAFLFLPGTRTTVNQPIDFYNGIALHTVQELGD